MVTARASGHVLEHRSLHLVTSMPVLYQTSAPYITAVLGECVHPAPGQEEMRLPLLSLCSMPAVNLSPACVQPISAQTTSPGQCIELGAEDTMYEILRSFSWEQKAKSPGEIGPLQLMPCVSPSILAPPCCAEWGLPSHLPAQAEDSCSQICPETFVTHPALSCAARKASVPPAQLLGATMRGNHQSC